VLPTRPSHPAGSFPLVIDYALAKGLAHEAFGHASEADGFRSSILREGRPLPDGRRRRRVPRLDHRRAEPGDHAWQPYSASGASAARDDRRPRPPGDALTDPWSQARSGAR
jgi:TldD protein